MYIKHNTLFLIDKQPAIKKASCAYVCAGPGHNVSPGWLLMGKGEMYEK